MCKSCSIVGKTVNGRRNELLIRYSTQSSKKAEDKFSYCLFWLITIHTYWFSIGGNLISRTITCKEVVPLKQFSSMV